jgi:hypothetical protein
MAAMICAAAAFAVEGAAVLGHHIPDHNWGARGAVVDLAGAIGFLASAAALLAFAAPLHGRRIGTGALRVAQTGLVAMTVESIASLVHGGNTLGPVFFVGLMFSLVGLLVVAVVGARDEGLRWVAALPFAGLFVSIAAGDQGGAIALAVVWLALARLAPGRRASYASSSWAATSSLQ